MRRQAAISRLQTTACVACLLCAGYTWAANGAAEGQTPSSDGNAAAVAPAVPAVMPRTVSRLDSEPIGPRAGPASSSGGPPHSQGLELPRIAGALALVIGLIFLLQWGGRKLFRQGAAGRSTRAVQILARAPLAPRQHIVLVRVGRRVIVIGDSGSQMNPLCEITDVDEIASLLGQLQDEKSTLPSRAFGALFSRAKHELEDGQEEASADESATEMPDPSTAETAEDASISDTREEITGLMAKIRLLSTHFRNGQT